MLRGIKAALEAEGLKVQAMCLTHTGSRNCGGGAMTAHSFVIRHVLNGTWAGDVLLIDEISFMPVELLGLVEHLRLRGVRIICFGDFGQLSCPSNKYRGCDVAPGLFESSQLLCQWSQGTRFTLKRCRRSDQAHFDFYTRLGPKSLEAALNRYPWSGQECDWHLTMSHFNRKRINDALQKRAAAKVPDGEKIWVDGGETPFHCFVGTRLIGSNNSHAKIVNGSFLTVTELRGEDVVIRDEDTDEVFVISTSQLASHTRLRWALTLVSVQGRTLQGSIGIHDFGSCFFTLAHLYVALSRATSGTLVFLVPPDWRPYLFSPPLK